MKAKKEKEDLSPIDEGALDSLSDRLLEGTLRVVSQVRDTVYSACDLITALSKRNGAKWREKAITRVKDEVLHSLTRSLTHSLTHLSLSRSLYLALSHSLSLSLSLRLSRQCVNLPVLSQRVAMCWLVVCWILMPSMSVC